MKKLLILILSIFSTPVFAQTAFSGAFVNYSAGTSGSQPTTSQLSSSTFGTPTGSYFNNDSNNHIVTTNSAGPTDSLLQPVVISGTTYTGAGGQNLQYTTGSPAGGYFSYYISTGYQTLYLLYELETDLPQNDTYGNWYDEPGNYFGGTYSNQFNPNIIANGSQLYIQEECHNTVDGTTYSSGTGSPVTLPYAGTIALPSNTPVWVLMKSTNDGTNGTISLYNSSGVQIGSTIGCAGRADTAVNVTIRMGVGGSETEASGDHIWWRNMLFSPTQQPPISVTAHYGGDKSYVSALGFDYIDNLCGDFLNGLAAHRERLRLSIIARGITNRGNGFCST